MKKWILEIGILLLALFSCTLNATQEQDFNNQRSLYINAINDGSILSQVSMTYPGFVSHVKKQGPDFFKSVFAGNGETSRLGSQVIQQTAKKGKRIQILFQVEMQNFTDSNSKRQFVGISGDDGKNWFFMPYEHYRNKQICKELPRLIK